MAAGGRTTSDRVAFLAAAVLTLWVALPFLRPDRWMTGFDTLAYSGPNLAVTHEATRDLRLPQWNPDIFGGAPHLGNPQAAVLDPLAWLASPLPVHRAMALMTVVRLVVLASGMWWLARRRLQLVPAAAAVATMGVTGSGLVMARSLQFEQIAVVSWVPWVLVGCDVAISRARWSGVVWAALPMAVAAVSGHPQQLYLAMPLAGLWCAGRLLDTGAGWAGFGRLAGAGTLAGAMAAPQLLPALTAMSDSAISEARSLAETKAYMVAIRQLPVLLLGDVTAADHAASAQTFEGLAFVGVVVAALAGLALFDRERPGRATRLLLAAAAAFGLVLSIGPPLPVYRVLYRVAPGFDLARVPGRWMLLTVVATSLLGGFGADRLLRGGLDRRTARVGAATMVAGVVVAVVALNRPAPGALAWWLLGTVVVAGLAAALSARLSRAAPPWVGVALVLVVLLELGWMSQRSLARQNLEDRPFDDVDGTLLAELAGEDGLVVALTADRLGDPDYLVPGLRPNANAALGIPSLDGYDGGVQVTDRWVEAVAALAPDGFDPELTLRSQIARPVPPALAARLGVRWLLVDRTLEAPAEAAPGWDEVDREGPFTLLENPEWRAPATLYRRTVPAAGDPAKALRETPPDVALVGGGGTLECEARCAPEPADLRRLRPEHLSASFEPDDAARLLVVDVQAADGWTAEVDGRSTPVVPANGMFLGIEVPAGAQRVDLRYTTPGLRLGSGGAAGAAAVLVGGWLVQRRRRGADGSGG